MEGRKAALFKQMNVRTAGLWSKTPLPRGMWKQVSLKSYAPNTIHAYDRCHVLAEKAKTVLKYPWVKPAAACGIQKQSRIQERAVRLCHMANGTRTRGPFGLRWDPSCRPPRAGA